MELKTLLVTGGAGFIGSNFIRYVLEQRTDVSVINVDLLTYAGNLANLQDLAENPRYRFIRGDVCDRAMLTELCQDGIDAIVHFAAESHVDRSINGPDPFVQTNVVGTHTVLEVARVSAVGRTLVVSTDEVYGSIPPDEYAAEDWPTKPSSPYSASKAAADLFALAYFGTYELPVIITRCGNNYGPYQFPEKLIPLMITHGMRSLDLPLYGDGLNTRDWIHVLDHCEALLAVLEKGTAGEIYNVSGGVELTNREVVDAILKELDLDESLVRYVADRPGHDRRYAMRASKLEREVGWKPVRGFEQGLKETVAWYVENREWWEVVQAGDHQRFYDEWYGEGLRGNSIGGLRPA